MEFIASVQGHESEYASSLDADSTLNIVAGDVLVLIVTVSLGSATITSIAEDDASNALTVLSSTDGSYNVITGYLLSASASSAATMRITLSGGPNDAGWEFTCLQFRPAANENVSFGAGPGSNNSDWGSNPISAQVSSSETDSLFVGGIYNWSQTLSSHQIGGASPDGIITGTAEFEVAYTIFDSIQTDITYGATASSSVWAAQLISLSIEVSAGSTLLPIKFNQQRRIYTSGVYRSSVRALPNTRFMFVDSIVAEAIQGVCEEILNIADANSNTAILQAFSSESMGFADVDTNIAQLLSALADALNIGDASARNLTSPATSAETINLSDSLSGIVKLLALSSDNLELSDVSTVLAQLQGLNAETINLSDVNTVLAQLQGLSSDNIELSDVISNLAQLQATGADTISLSDVAALITSLEVFAADTINISDVNSVIAQLQALCADTFSLSENLISTLTALAIVSEVVRLADGTEGDVLGSLLGVASEILNLSAVPTARADLISSVLEQFNISESILNTLSALATTAETINLSDASTLSNILAVLSSETLNLSDIASVVLNAFALSAETVQFTDANTVTATFDVQASDAFEMAEAITNIANLRASLSDGLNLIATPIEVSQLPVGKATISFSLKTPSTSCSIKTPGISGNIKIATLIFNIK